MPYALNAARMQRWQSLFLDADYSVTALPSYQNEDAANPFIAFRELPETARYKFMLDEAQFTIMGFIKHNKSESHRVVEDEDEKERAVKIAKPAKIKVETESDPED